jgi:hypothetical protein
VSKTLFNALSIASFGGHFILAPPSEQVTVPGGIPVEYLSQLHKYHEEWISNTTIPVYTVNTEKDHSTDAHLEEVSNFVKTM